MKKYLSLFLALAMVLSMCSFASAEAKEEITLNVMLPDFYADAEWKTFEDGNPILKAIYDFDMSRGEILSTVDELCVKYPLY